MATCNVLILALDDLIAYLKHIYRITVSQLHSQALVSNKVIHIQSPTCYTIYVFLWLLLNPLYLPP